MTDILDPSLQAALAELAQADPLLVALDFDGTLAPEVDDPEQARALPEARSAVLRLMELPQIRVALISGRALASLEKVADLPDSALLVGSHGIELRLDTPETRLSLDPSELARRGDLGRLLDDVAASVDRAWIESKPAGFALHTRLATDADGRRAHLVALQRTEAELPGLTVRHGKNVLEFSVRSTTKGEAIEHLRRYTGAKAVFYAGDDVTDEDAFVALVPGDLGLKSGAGETAARFRVAEPAAVAAALHELVRLREARVTS